jgi:hypothetical protein
MHSLHGLIRCRVTRVFSDTRAFVQPTAEHLEHAKNMCVAALARSAGHEKKHSNRLTCWQRGHSDGSEGRGTPLEAGMGGGGGGGGASLFSAASFSSAEVYHHSNNCGTTAALQFQERQ